MTQPIDIITRAMKDIGAVAAGEVPTADEAQDGLDMLNDLIAQWSNENMMVFYRSEIIFQTTQNQVQYTIGPSGQMGGDIHGVDYWHNLDRPSQCGDCWGHQHRSDAIRHGHHIGNKDCGFYNGRWGQRKRGRDIYLVQQQYHAHASFHRVYQRHNFNC